MPVISGLQYSSFHMTSAIKRMVRNSSIGIISILLSLSNVAVHAEVLNRDSSFEDPVLNDGVAVDSSTFSHWDVSLSAGAAPVLLRRGSGANQGAQYLEIQADGTSSHSRKLSQDLAISFGTNRYLLRTRLRSSGVPPAEGAGNLILRVVTTLGAVVATHTIDYATIDNTWRGYTLWPADATISGNESGNIRFEIELANMGSDSSFSVWIDDVRMETIDVEDTLADDYIPNGSFELIDIKGVGTDPTLATETNVDSWTISSQHSSRFFMEADGGSKGAQFISAKSVTGGLTDNTIKLDNYDGSVLAPTCPDGDKDGLCRFEVAIDARYSGTHPDDRGRIASEQGNIWMHLYPSDGNAASQNLMTRHRIGFWELSEDFQTFRLEGDTTRSTVTDSSWLPGADIDIIIRPHNSLNTGSAIDVDNFRIDRIEAPEMMRSTDVILLDPERIVPSRFLTDIKGNKRGSAVQYGGNNSVYRFYLPSGIDIVAAGNDTALEELRGNINDVYQLPFSTAPDVWIEGQRYSVIELIPTKLHGVAQNNVGPIYFSTALPTGTRSKIYYETSWTRSDGTAATPERRSVAVETVDFPNLTAPKHWVTSLMWITASVQIHWRNAVEGDLGRNYFEDMKSLGFNSVGGFRGWDGYMNDGLDVSTESANFYDLARNAGMALTLNDSPWNWTTSLSARSIDADTQLPIDGAACPAYGLMPDESIYGDGLTDASYTNQRDSMATWIAAVRPDVLQFDSEGFISGSAVSLREPLEDGKFHKDGLTHLDGCQRCDDYQALHGHATMEEALIAMGVHRTRELNDAVDLANAANAAANGTPVIPIETKLGYYHTRANFTYQNVFDLEALVAAGEIDIGYVPYYSNISINGESFRAHRKEALTAGVTIYPIMETGSLNPWGSAANTYNLTNELLASGAPGLLWFPFDRATDGDFYYYGKALEALLPVEHLLVQSTPVDGVSSAIADPNELDPDRYRLRATAVKTGNDYIILVSSYGKGAQNTSNHVANQDPHWIGSIDVTLPSAVSGDIVRLADNSVVGTANGSNVLNFEFRPGIAKAKTAVFHLCDTSSGSCVDTDGDLVKDDIDNCPDVYNDDQADDNGDGIGDACDNDSDGVTDALDNCPVVSNGDQVNTDGDAEGDACDVDDDNDTVLDAMDNCPVKSNIDQSNIDHDLQGDACDADIDGDGSINIDDCEPTDLSIYPGAAEIYNDDIIQNCNRTTDPKITVIKASYSDKKSQITIEAYTSAGINDPLTMELASNITAMEWSNRQGGRWMLKYSIAVNPGVVTIRGLEGHIDIDI